MNNWAQLNNSIKLAVNSLPLKVLYTWLFVTTKSGLNDRRWLGHIHCVTLGQKRCTTRAKNNKDNTVSSPRGSCEDSETFSKHFQRSPKPFQIIKNITWNMPFQVLKIIWRLSKIISRSPKICKDLGWLSNSIRNCENIFQNFLRWALCHSQVVNLCKAKGCK